MNENKNQILQLKVLRKLIDHGEDAFLTIIGQGPMQKKLKESAKELNLKKNVYFAGNQSSPASLLNEANLFIHTAKREGFGLAMIEAMACGLPVISLDGIGNRNLIIEGENGFLIDKEDENIFCDKILTIDSGTYQTMSKKAKIFAQSHGINEYSNKLLEFYKV